MWKTTTADDTALAGADPLAAGCSLKATGRLVKVTARVVRRVNGQLGDHGAAFHDERVQHLAIEAVAGDARQGAGHDKGQPVGEAELIDRLSKVVGSQVQGQRDECLIGNL